MIAEVLIKVGGNKDGFPLISMAPGLHISSAEFEVWRVGGSLPSSFTSLPTAEHNAHLARLEQIRDGILVSDPDALYAHSQIQQVGYDTRWGFKDLYGAGVLLVDITQAQLDTLTAWVSSSKFRAFKVPYDQILSAASLAEWLSPSSFKHVNRGATPLDLSGLQLVTT